MLVFHHYLQEESDFRIYILKEAKLGHAIKVIKNNAGRNDINIHMVVYRLPQFTTDILLTFNDPVNVE